MGEIGMLSSDFFAGASDGLPCRLPRSSEHQGTFARTIRRSFSLAGTANFEVWKRDTSRKLPWQSINQRNDMASWWFFTNPFEKYARQIGTFPQGSGWQFQKCLKPPPSMEWHGMTGFLWPLLIKTTSLVLGGGVWKWWENWNFQVVKKNDRA